MNTCITNGIVKIHLESGFDVQTIIDRLISFLNPYFYPVEGQEPHFTILVKCFEDLDPSWTSFCNKPILIRQSSKKLFNLTGLYGNKGDGIVGLIDNETNTAFIVDQRNKKITAYISESSFIHLIELIRYTALLIEEAEGTMLLHASAVTKNGQAVLMVGEKHAGKTTALLQLILHCGFSIFSGDKILLRLRNDQLWLRAWPDYPHIGMGTIRQHHRLIESLAINQLDVNGNYKDNDVKELVDPERFRKAIPHEKNIDIETIKCIIFPNISKEVTSFEKVPLEQITISNLNRYIEYPFQFTPGHWHGLFTNIARTKEIFDSTILMPLLEVPWMTCDGDFRLALSEVVL